MTVQLIIALTNIFAADYIKNTFITIKDAEDKTQYYSGTFSILSMADSRSVIKALARVKDNNVKTCLAIALRNRDPNVRANAAWAWKEITGENFSEDPRKWQEWWQKNKRKTNNDK